MPLALSPTGSPQQAAAQPAEKATPGLALILGLFFVSFLLPYNGQVLGMLLYPTRVVVLILFVPCLVGLLLGRAGRRTWIDGLLGLYALWAFGSLLFHHGLERLPYAAILGIEAFGGYAIARLTIRNETDYRRFVAFYLLTVLLMILPAMKECIEGNPARFGFARAKLNFPNGILYGLFCSMAVANAYYLYRRNLFAALPRMGVALFATAMSLSSAPLLSAALQLYMILWDRLTGGRWKLFVSLGAVLYVFLELFTRRGAVIFLINKLTFNPATGYMRVYIWEYGKQNVLANPLLGIGLNDWERPRWMASSVDNFWLLTAMRHGLPAILLLLAAFALHIRAILRQQGLSPGRQDIRTGYLVTLMGVMFTLTTVHIWDEVLIFVMFYLGAGAFLYTSAPAAEGPALPQAEAADPRQRRALPLTRFPAPLPALRPSRPAQARRGGLSRSLPPKAQRP